MPTMISNVPVLSMLLLIDVLESGTSLHWF